MLAKSWLGALGIRARLMMLIAVAMLPLGGLAAYYISAGMDEAIAQSKASLRRTANVTADWEASLFDQARYLLEAAREDPDVASGSGPGCEAGVKGLLAGNPQFLTMGVIERDATISCHTKIRDRRTFTDPSLVDRVLAPGAPDLVVGNFMIGKVTGQPTVAVAMALPGPSGRVAFISLDLKRLSMAARQASDNGTLEVTIVQPSAGRMLTHYPPIDIPFGTELVGNGLVAAMRAAPEGGFAQAKGPDGVERIYAFAPVHGSEATGMMLAVGETKGAVLGSIHTAAATAAVLWFTVFALALAGASWMGWATQLKPLARIARFARELEEDRDGARIDMEAWQARELRALGRTLNGTAERLEEARRNDELVAASEAKFRILAENTADLVTLLDAAGRRTFVSPASRDILGLEPDALLGRAPREIAHPEDASTVDAMLAALRSGRAVHGVRYRMAHRDGHHVWVEVGGRPLEGGKGMVMSVRDITLRRRMEEDLEQANRALAELATTDGLTSLLNRRAFDVALARELGRCRRERTGIALLFIDVDRFKGFNDTYGHVSGDSCLRRVSEALSGELRRPGDIAARYGGEEFAVILPATSESGTRARAAAILAAVRDLAIPNVRSEHGVVTISIGTVTLSPAEVASLGEAGEIVSSADRALYAAKAEGRNRVAHWTPEIAA